MAEYLLEDGVLTIDYIGSGVSKWILVIQEMARLAQSGQFTTAHPFDCAQVTGSGSDPENMGTDTHALQSTETSPALVSGAGERNYPWEPVWRV